jgi:hypothetical protein
MVANHHVAGRQTWMLQAVPPAYAKAAHSNGCRGADSAVGPAAFEEAVKEVGRAHAGTAALGRPRVTARF